MLRYSLERIFLVVPTIFIVLFITFWLGVSLPGDPILTFIMREGKTPDEETIARMRHDMGLDRPFMVRWTEWMAGLTHGELGKNVATRRDISELVARRLPISAQLGLAAFVVMAIGGILLGTIAAIKQNTWVDNLIVAGTLFINSFPIYVLAPISLIVVVLYLKLIPSGFGWEGLFSSKAILPILLYAAPGWVYVTRMTRAGLIEVLGQDYVRTARAKGLPERMVIVRHILKNGLTGTVTSLGLSVAGMITGSLFLETAFGIPGYGDMAVSGLLALDINTIMATTLIGALLVMGANLVTDLLYGVLDPRVRYE